MKFCQDTDKMFSTDLDVERIKSWQSCYFMALKNGEKKRVIFGPQKLPLSVYVWINLYFLLKILSFIDI